MTVKNFLKTAVLGIAFCSVLGMNNSMAADNNIHNICVQIQNQIHVSIHNEFMPYCAPELIEGNAILNISKSILKIMHKAENELISQAEYDLLLQYLDELQDADQYGLRNDLFINIQEYIMNNTNEIKNLLQQRIDPAMMN